METQIFFTLCNVHVFQIEYVSSTQMVFLQLLSSQAEQTFTYRCLNSVAYYDEAAKSYSSAIRLLSDNEYVHRTQKLNSKYVQDGCKVSAKITVVLLLV